MALCCVETYWIVTYLVPLWIQLSNTPPGSRFDFVIIWIIRYLKNKTSARIALLIQTTFHYIVSSLKRVTLSLLEVPFPFTQLMFRKRILDNTDNKSVMKGKVNVFIYVKMRWEVYDLKKMKRLKLWCWKELHLNGWSIFHYFFSCLDQLWFRNIPARRQAHGDIYQSDKSPFKLEVYLFIFYIAIVEVPLSARSSDGDNTEW